MGLGTDTTRPNDMGFDFWYGFLDERRAGFQYPDWIWRNGEKVEFPDNPSRQLYHAQNRFANEALAFIRRHQARPFFLYLPLAIGGQEMIVPPEYESEFVEKFGEDARDAEPYRNWESGYNRPRRTRAAFAGVMTFLAPVSARF